jgi:hypothetical protein
MKRILSTFLLIHVISICLAQTDSTEYKLHQLKQGMIYMRENFNECHKEFRAGMITSFVGVAVSVGGAVTKPSERIDGSKNYTLQTILLIGGSAVSLIGMIVVIDSHKYIGRAGNWQFNGNSITSGF